MAELIKTDGTIEKIVPQNGEEFELEEMYKLLGCDTVEVVYLQGTNDILVIDEEGKLNGKELNMEATRRARLTDSIAAFDCIVGDAVVCESRLFD